MFRSCACVLTSSSVLPATDAELARRAARHPEARLPVHGVLAPPVPEPMPRHRPRESAEEPGLMVLHLLGQRPLRLPHPPVRVRRVLPGDLTLFSRSKDTKRSD